MLRIIVQFQPVAAFAALCFCGISGVSAQGRQGYESSQTQSALQKLGLAADRNPVGKVITGIRLDRHDVFEPGEFWPDFFTAFNALHGLTDPQVIQRELTFSPGEAFSATKVEESMRNLRALGIFALVRIEPARSPDGSGLIMVVYTRDLWSLRLETEFVGAGASLRATGQMTERNVLGRNKQLALRASYRPISASIGQSYRDYRFLGERVQLQEAGDVYYNYRTGRVEGGSVSASLSRPFYRLAQSLSFELKLSHLSWVHRDLAGAVAATVGLQAGDGTNCDVQEASCARSVYRERATRLLATVRKRYGGREKHTFSVGAGLLDVAAQQRSESAVGAGFEAEFAKKVLPRSRRGVYPHAGYGFFVTDFVNYQNLGSYGVTETVRAGPTASFAVKVPLRMLGSSADALRVDGRLGYVLAASDALLDFSVAYGARLENDAFINRLLRVRLRGATPTWFAGRLVASGLWERRQGDSNRTFVYLGADNGLRGYAIGNFRGYGASKLLLNLEYRSLPLELSSVHVGGVAFFDTGSVFSGHDSFAMHHGAGFGVRVLFPQFNVLPFRLDVGVPVGASGFSMLLSYGSSHAVPLTAAEDALVSGVSP